METRHAIAYALIALFIAGLLAAFAYHKQKRNAKLTKRRRPLD